MTELVVVLLLSVLGIGVSAYVLRWLLALPTGDAEMNRVASLIREASEAFSRRLSGTTAALSALVGGALFLAYGLRTSVADAVSGLELGVWLLVSFALGSAGTIAIGEVSTFVATRGAVRTASAARRSVDATLRASLRTGAATALFATALSTATMGGLYLAVLAYHGALGAEPSRSLAIVPHIPILLIGHALGASFSALLSQIAGGTFAKGADIGADIGARDVGIEDDDPDNPAVVANLAGDCVAGAASSATSAFAQASVVDAAAMLGLALVYSRDTGLRSPLAILLLPLLSRSFSLLGTSFGALIVRTDDRENPLAPLVRGLLIAAVLHTVGLVGAIEWLLPDRRAPLLAGALIGVGVAAAVVGWAHYVTTSRFQPVRDVAEAFRGGPTLGLLAGLGHGLGSTAWPLLALFVGALSARYLGQVSGSPSGELLALAGLLVGLVGASPFLLALEASAAAVDAASGIVTMTVGRDRPDVRGRLLVLDGYGASHRAEARAIAACTALPATAIVLEVTLAEWARRTATDPPAPPFGFGAPLTLVFGAVLGGLLVIWIMSRVVLGVLRSARRILEEVRRQLRDRTGFLAHEKGETARTGQSIDYGPCCEMASRYGLRLMALLGLVTIVAPVVLIVGLRLWESEDKGRAVGGSVASLIVAATVVGVLGALFAIGAGGVWGNAKKYIVTGAHGGRLLVDETGARAENPTFVASVIGDTVGDPLKDVAVPVVLVFVQMLPLLALALLPLIL